MPISDSQVFVALFVALVTGVFAVRLGVELYKLVVMGAVSNVSLEYSPLPRRAPQNFVEGEGTPSKARGGQRTPSNTASRHSKRKVGCKCFFFRKKQQKRLSEKQAKDEDLETSLDNPK